MQPRYVLETQVAGGWMRLKLPHPPRSLEAARRVAYSFTHAFAVVRVFDTRLGREMGRATADDQMRLFA